MRQTKETSGLVLIVEDNRNISEMIGEYLEGRGFEVDYAVDGLMAIVWPLRTAMTWWYSI